MHAPQFLYLSILFINDSLILPPGLNPYSISEPAISPSGYSSNDHINIIQFSSMLQNDVMSPFPHSVIEITTEIWLVIIFLLSLLNTLQFNVSIDLFNYMLPA